MLLVYNFSQLNMKISIKSNSFINVGTAFWGDSHIILFLTYLDPLYNIYRGEGINAICKPDPFLWKKYVSNNINKQKKQKKSCLSSPPTSLCKGRVEAFFSGESDSTLSPES